MVRFNVLGRQVFALLACSGLAVAVGCGKKKDNKNPAPTPSKSIEVGNFFNDSGDKNFFLGECGAFTVTGENTTFDAGVQLEFEVSDGTGFTVNPQVIQVNSPTELRIGGDACVFFNRNSFTLGSVKITVADGGDLIELEDAINIVDTPYHSLGKASDGASTDSSGVSDAEANSFQRFADVDYYEGVADATDTDSYIGWLVNVGSTPTSGDVIPRIFVSSDNLTSTYGASIAGIALFPAPAAGETTARAEVFDSLFRGDDQDYLIEQWVFDAASITALTGVDTWDDPGNAGTQNPAIETIAASGLYTSSLTGMTQVYDPMDSADPPGAGEAVPDSSCFAQIDQLEITAAEQQAEPYPIYGGGLDTVFLLDIPAESAAYVTVLSTGDAEGVGGDLTLYAVEDPANDIPAPVGDGSAQIACAAGADAFSTYDPSNTQVTPGSDGMYVVNDTNAAKQVYLFVDQYSGDHNQDDTPAYVEVEFALWVEFR